jgi:predicted HD superfamily hydrolase involved in NAD metabolism
MSKIPPPLDDLVFVQGWVKQRVSPKRFGHIVGVAQTAKKLASQFREDSELIFQAELAGWLHDSCKEMEDALLVEKAKEYGLKLDPIEEANGHLLHGPVAAQFVKHEFGLKNQDILNAMAEHTLGAAPMSLLSKIVFLADAIEPGRPAEYADPIREPLKSGGVHDPISPLDKAILIACESNLQFLEQNGKAIHPRTIAVRDYYRKICQSKA